MNDSYKKKQVDLLKFKAHPGDRQPKNAKGKSICEGPGMFKNRYPEQKYEIGL